MDFDVGEFANSHGIGDLSDRRLAFVLDSEDSLSSLRNEFFVPKMATLPGVDKNLVDPKEESIYLCGNSLGLLPKATKRFLDQQLDKWAEMGVFGHHDGPLPWISADECIVEGIEKLVGAKSGEVALANGLTVNLHILLTAFYKPTESRYKILIESQSFPSDHYAVESQIRLNGRKVENTLICMPKREGEELTRTEDILELIEREGDSIAVILFGAVQYYTGQFFDIPKITEAAHKKGCLIGWDLAHAFANVPLRLHDWDIDFGVWCSYKYGCTGAGGLAGLFVHQRFANDRRERMLGWWSHKEESRFQMSNILDLDSGANGYRISNPPILLVCAVAGFLEAIKSTNMEELRAKSIRLTAYLQTLIDFYFSAKSESRIRVSLITPRDPLQRGCQLSLKFNCDIALIYEELVRRGCAVDKRYPNVIRVAPVHLYNSFDDCWRFVSVLRESIAALNDQLSINQLSIS